MKKTWILACTLLLVSAVGFAQTPSGAPLTPEVIDAILDLPRATGSCATAKAPSRMIFAAQKPGPGGGVSSMAYCVAYCEWGTVSCQGNISCSAFDRNCTTACERGHVTCNDTVNGTFTNWCPTECPTSHCCDCEASGWSDCLACCRCDGHSAQYCASLCDI
jgi:hypothetical protein